MVQNEQHGQRLIVNSVYVLINNLFTVAVSWIISIWVARQLGPANYGIFSLVLWFSSILSWALGMGLIHAATKFIAEAKGRTDGDCTPIVFFVMKIEIVVSLLVTVALFFFRSEVADYFFSPNESFFFLLAALGLLPGMLTAVFSATIEGIQKFGYFTLSSLIISPLTFAAKVYVLMTGWGIEGLLVVMLVFSVVNAVFYYVILRREGFFRKGSPTRLAPDLRSRIMKYNNSVIAILICDKIVWDKSENFFLGRICDATQVAYYNLGFNIAQRFISMLPFTFWKVLFPAMSSYFGSGDRQKMERIFFLSTRYLAFFAFPMGVAGSILAYPLIFYFYGHDYVGAQRSLQIIFCASIFSSLSNPASAVLYGFEKQSFIYKYGAILAVFNIILDIFLIKKHGAMGAATAYGITTIFASVGGLIYTCRTMKLRYPVVSIFKIMLSTILMGVVMVNIILKYPVLPGYVISAFAGTIAYLICGLVLGTFEKEDYTLLESVKKVMPGRLKDMMDSIIGFISQFKNDR